MNNTKFTMPETFKVIDLEGDRRVSLGETPKNGVWILVERPTSPGDETQQLQVILDGRTYSSLVLSHEAAEALQYLLESRRIVNTPI